MTAQNTQRQLTITLKLFGGLSSYRPDDPDHYPIALGMTLSELIKQLSIPTDIALTTFVNGKNATLDSRLQGNEEVKIFPLIGGG